MSKALLLCSGVGFTAEKRSLSWLTAARTAASEAGTDGEMSAGVRSWNAAGIAQALAWRSRCVSLSMSSFPEGALMAVKG